jgi:hypothetical protein
MCPGAPKVIFCEELAYRSRMFQKFARNDREVYKRKGDKFQLTELIHVRIRNEEQQKKNTPGSYAPRSVRNLYSRIASRARRSSRHIS